MHHRIAAALDEDRFELLLQPVMNLHTGAVDKYEALLRMIDEDGSTIAPAAFLYVAERFVRGLGVDHARGYEIASPQSLKQLLAQ